MSENEIAVSTEENLPGIIDPKTFKVPVIPNPYAEDFSAFTSGLFLPRLQLEGSNSNLVRYKKVQAGTWSVISGKDQFENLGESIDVLCLTYRSKALDLNDRKNIAASFDKNSDLFKSIVAASQNKSKGYMYGLEFLVYVPDVKGEQKFATLFMGNPTMRQEAKNFKPLIGKPVTLKTKLISNTEFTWEAPVILPCTGGLSSYPTQEEMTLQMQIFVDPPKDKVVETVPDDEVAGVGTDDRGN